MHATRRSRSRFLLFTLLLLSLPLPILAEGYEADAPITAVRVSQQGAVATRTGAIDVAAGEHELVVTGLPAALDLSRLTLSLDNAKAKLGGLRIRRVYQNELIGESQQPLQEELDKIRYERGLIDDAIAAAETQLKLLDSLSTGQMDSSFSSAQEFASLITLVDSSANAAKRRIRDAQREGAKLDILIIQKQEQLAQFSSRERYTHSAIASIDVAKSTRLEFTVSYPIRGARWEWLYEARLDTTRRFLEIGRQVAVTQTTGESWNDVALTISTGNASSQIAPPSYLGQVLTLSAPKERAFAVRAESSAMRAGSALEEAVVTTYKRSSSEVTGTAFQVDYRVPGAVSVLSGNEQQVFTIDERGLEVELIAISRPLQDANAYLEARFTLEEEFPIQAGSMQFYRDGSFIGTRWISGFLPNEETRMSFGLDSRIKIRVEVDEEESDAGGTFRRTAVKNTRTRVVVTSFHSGPKEIDVLALIPVAQSEDIDVKFDDDATPPTERDVDGNTGEVRWRLMLKPTQTETINHFYSVRYPRGETLHSRSSR